MIQASSSGYDGRCFAKITINDVPVDVDPNENNHHRGLHIVVINPSTGKAQTAQSFDTYESSALLDYFISAPIPDGYIVAAACRDDCVSQLSEESKQWFESMGSKEIWNVGYR